MSWWVRAQVYRASAENKLRRLLHRPNDPYPPRPPNSSLSPFLGSRAATDEAPRRFALDPNATADDVRAWQETARQLLSKLAGYVTSAVPPAVTAAGETVRAGSLNRTTYYLRVRPATDVSVTLLSRTDLRNPTALFLYMAGSTSGVHLGWGDVKVPIDHQRISIGADIARQAARRGYRAACIEQIGYGERAERNLVKRSSDRTIDAANHASLVGRTLMGLKAMDVSAVLNWLLAGLSPFAVDPARIFLFGHSAGGSAAIYAAALDPRIQGVLASGSVGRIADTIGARRNASGDGIVPGILNAFEMDNLIALVAPRAFVGLSGRSDHIFPFQGVERAVEGARPAFTVLAAANRLAAVPVPGPHRYYAAESWVAWRGVIDPDCGIDPELDATAT